MSSPPPERSSAPALSAFDPWRTFAETQETPLPPLQESARYELRGLIGAGGTGRVRVAWDQVLQREVALKELSPDLATATAWALRLAREAWITAQLDHPGIVAVHDAGRLPDGRPFYTMRLVRGRTLEQAMREAVSEEDRLRLLRNLLTACEAMAFAHKQGVVHRDLKPANLLVGGFGETQVVDWGLAVATPEAEARWATLGLRLAHNGGITGTPAWMSPEQARGEPVGPEADVFALGTILFELLSGQLPYGDGDAFEQVGRRNLPPPALRAVAPHVPAELAAVVDRALAFQPGDRYADAAGLAQDLASWLEGGLVGAYRYQPWDLAWRLVQRFRWPLLVAWVAAIALAVAISLGVQRTREERDRALAAEAQASEAREVAQQRLALSLAAEAQRDLMLGDRASAEQKAVAALELAEVPTARGVLAGFSGGRPRRVSARPGPACRLARLAADGAQLGCGGDGEIALYDWEVDRPIVREPEVAANLELVDGLLLADRGQGRWVAHRPGHPPEAGRLDRWPRVGGIWSARQLSPELRYTVFDQCAGVLAFARSERGQTAAACNDGRIGLLEAGAPLRWFATPFTGPHEATSLAWVPGRDQLVIGSLRGRVGTLDLRSGETSQPLETSLGSLQELRISPDGRRAAVVGTRPSVGLIDLEQTLVLGLVPSASRPTVAFAGPHLLRVFDGRWTTWDLTEMSGPSLIQAATGLSDARLSPTGDLVALAGTEGLLQIFETATGRRRVDQRLGSGVVRSLSFGSGGARLTASTSIPGDTSRWSLDTPEAGPELRLAGLPLRRVVELEDDLLFGASSHLGLYALTPAGLVRSLPDLSIVDLERSRNLRSAVAVDDRGQVWRMTVDQPEPRLLFQLPDLRSLDVGPGDTFAAVLPNEARLVTANGGTLRRFPHPGAVLREVRLTPDGRFLVAGDLEGTLTIWDALTGQVRARVKGHEERIASLDITDDSRLALSAGWDGRARWWDLTLLDQQAPALRAIIDAAWGEPPPLDP